MSEEALRKEIDAAAAAIQDLKKAKGVESEEYKAAVLKMAALRKQLPAKDDKPKDVKSIQTSQTYFASRLATVDNLGQLTGAYPHKWQVDMTIPAFRATFGVAGKFANGVFDKAAEISIAGRIVVKRSASSKLHFLEIRGDMEDLQVLSPVVDYDGNAEAFAAIHNIIKRGDIIGIRGYAGVSQTGELSILAREIRLLSACFHMLPDDHAGQGAFSDIENRFRQRYVDLIVNKTNAKTFQQRAKIIAYIRRFFDNNDFVEVETPVLTMIPGGAAARPFVTHHNDLNCRMYLRIATELYLKQLVVGGMDRVYELGRQFRNESIDLTHNPEFTSIEAYWAYKDHEDIMKMTEDLLSGLAMHIHGSHDVRYAPKGSDGKEATPITFNFKPPFARLYILPELEKRCNVKFPAELESDAANKWLVELCKKEKVECTPPTTTPRVIDALIAHFLEPLCTNPTFICDHPLVMSPLAKWHRNDHRLSERFELFVNKKELCNAFTELNNPIVQRRMFEQQMADRAKGDDEAMPIDEEFIKALEHGLPPTAGWGMGVDRLIMFMTSQSNIKEVLCFPAMKLEHQSNASDYPPGTLRNGQGVPSIYNF